MVSPMHFAAAAGATAAIRNQMFVPYRPREPIVQSLPVSLEMLYRGGVVSCSIVCQTKNGLGPLEPPREKIYDVEILRGYKPGTKVKFDKSFPDEELYPNEPKCDMSFIIEEEMHKMFRRQGDHLIANIYLTRGQVKAEHFEVTLKLLSDEKKNIRCSGLECLHGTCRTLPGFGMPIRKGGQDTGQHGDLKIYFWWPLSERTSKCCTVS